MARYPEELLVSAADWRALAARADEAGLARALLGLARSPGVRRALVAEILPAGMPLPAILARCRAERMGLLETYAQPDERAVAARLADLSAASAATPLVVAAAQERRAWALDRRAGRPATVELRLLGRAFHDDPPAHGRGPVDAPIPPRLERQVAALGQGGQRRLAGLSVAVVGCGGTGGLAAQLLALAGVGRLLLIDDDRVEQSNRNRLVAASEADAQRGALKVAALRRHLRRLAPDVAVVAIPRLLYDARSARAIQSADLLLGCTDNEGSRLHMNALAVQYLLPYVDCGVGIERGADGLIAGGQVRVVVPGGPCLECYGGIDRWLAARDLSAGREQAHGYGLGGRPAPALALLNAAIAAEAAASVVAIATGLRPVWPFLAYDMVGARLAPREDATRCPACPVCAPGRRYGRGDSLPLPRPSEDDALPLPRRVAREVGQPE